MNSDRFDPCLSVKIRGPASESALSISPALARRTDESEGAVVMNSPQVIFENASPQLIMAAQPELRFTEAHRDLAGTEFLAPGFLSNLFAAERRATYEAEELKAIESSLFPRTLPPLGTVAYAGVSVGARHVGGDFYDFFARGDGRLGIVIGDISGKGIPAALLKA